MRTSDRGAPPLNGGEATPGQAQPLNFGSPQSRENTPSLDRRQQVRQDLAREIGVFVHANKLDTLKLLREIEARWPDARAGEIRAAFAAATEFAQGAADE